VIPAGPGLAGRNDEVICNRIEAWREDIEPAEKKTDPDSIYFFRLFSSW